MGCTVVGNEIHRRFDLTMMPAIFALFFVSLVLGGRRLFISCHVPVLNSTSGPFIQYLTHPPEITLKPNSQQVRNGASVSFYCAARGDPSPTLYWKKNGKRISENISRYQMTNFTGNGLSLLRIDPTRAVRDNATYECVAENGVGDAVSAEAKLTVFEEKKLPLGFPNITSPPASKAVEVGHTAVLQCTAIGDPMPTITWIRDQNPLDINNNDRYSVLDKGSPGALQIINSLESDQGKYECVAENSVGSEYSEPVSLYVKVRRVAPQFSIAPPQYKEVKLGDDFNITCVAIGSPMPYVKWQKFPNIDITSEDQLPVGKNVLEIKNAQTSENYTCIAASSLGTVNATTYVKVQSLPGPPIDIKVTEVTATSVRLSWTHSNPADLQYYVIHYKPRHANQAFAEISGVITLYYTIRNLSPYTEYEFYVIAVNNLGRGPPSAPTIITTGETAPGTAPRNVQVRPLSSSTMVIQWDEPESPNGQVTAYKVYYTTNPDASMSSWSSQFVDTNLLTTIGDLTPLTMYTIRVQAFTSVGPGPLSAPVQIKTQQGVPSQPRDLRATEIGEASITLEWTKPAHSGENILGYDLMWNDTYSKERNHRRIPVAERYTLEDLYPNTLYYIWLSARSQRGEGATTSPIPVRTKQYVPGAPPQNVTGEAVGPTSIYLRWEPPPPNRTNGQITYYKVFKVEATRNDSEADVITVTNDTFVRLDELKRWTEYRLWILAGTAVGDGPTSNPLLVKTHEDVPGPPTDVKAAPVNSTTIFVEWKPPAENERNGIIRQYHIHVQETKHEGTSLLNEPMRVVVQNSLEYNVTDLQPDTFYLIQVAALTRKGDGARSPLVSVRTPGGVPIRPTINLKMNSRDADITLDVEWTKPTQTYGELKGYKLRYGIKDQTLIDVILKSTVNQYRLTNLERGVEYEFRVAGQNQIGFGQEAISYLETPEGTPTGPPTALSHYFQTPDVVCIKWETPTREHRNGKIVRYDIEFHKKVDQPVITHRNTTQQRAVFSALEEGTEYVYSVRAATRQGSGPWSGKEVFSTTKEMVRAPMGLKAMATSDQSVEVWWEPIPSVRHKLYGYMLFYTMTAVEDLDAWQKKSIGLTESAELVSLEKNAQYAVAVAANTSVGLGRLSEKIAVKVKPEDVPLDLRAKEVTTHSMTLTWSRPIKLNPISYQVSYDAFKEFVDSQGVTQSQPVPRKTIQLAPNVETTHIENLSPFTTYNINVTAKAADSEYRPPTRITVTTQMAAPLPMVKPDFYGVNNDEEMITVILPQASEEYGPISHYYLVVVPENMETKEITNPDQFLTNELLNYTKETAEGKPYIAARFAQRNIPYTYHLGAGETSDEFVNRKLQKGRRYRIFVRAVVDTQKNLYTSSPFSEPLSLEMRTVPPGDIPRRPDIKNAIESDIAEVSKINKVTHQSMLWYIAPILAVAVLCVLIVMFFIMKSFYRRRLPTKYREPCAVTRPLMSEEVTASHAPSDPVEMRRLMYQTPAMVSHPPIPVSMLAQHIEMLKANDNLKFSQEYESIEPGQQFTWDHSSMEINKRKNRYANVIAYDHSRVVLQDTEAIPGGDYINANYCDGYRKHNAYIATQGPLQETFGDFWKMCWEVKTSTIVMMTKLEERTRIKCDQYWPSRGTETFGTITVTLSDIQELATYCIRTFHINKGMDSERREIKQLQFTAWPDHGVPDHSAPFLQFLRRVKNVNPVEAGPVIVHCSAGVGRTGCYIVIDAMIERLKYEKSVDIYGHVTCLRAQRNYMVQTEDQYIFIHDAVVEHVICGVTEIPARNLHAHIQKLMQMPEGETVTGLALEFKKLSNMKCDSNRFISASLPCNKHKNRLVHILPIENTRVCLAPIRGVEGSDYINASMIDGYRQRVAYIATQGPLQDTTDDFWRMLWEHNSTIVVMLTKLKEMGREKCYQYWPSERSVRYQCLVVEPIAEYNMPLYVLREFKITDARDGSSRTLRQFQFNDWPEQGIPKTGDGFIDFIGQVHKTKEQFGQEGPITVHCSAGVGRTGVFITLSIVLERMQYEGVVDLFQTVRILRTQRPAMVQTEEQYQFCYQSALEYLGSFDHYTN
ncbi:tyrosine-protein phosphatase Lar isoform X3 [Planococcus citri]|uniref:tyrosine-protein phosphatase Lar isoform X3 n=1 Tax=Planococcus citri TaxID=170843 RepID=UPI0031F988B9